MRYTCFLLLLFFGIRAHAEKVVVVNDDSIPQGKNSRFLLFPFILKSPETNFGFGAASAYFFKAKKNDPDIRTSDVDLISLYTLRKQFVAVLNTTVFFPKESEIFRFQASYSYYPDRFWGLGNNTVDANKEDYKMRQYFLNPQLLMRVVKKWYIGGSFEFQRITHFNYTSGGIFDSQLVPGRYGGNTSGLGLLLTWDTRNNAYSPSKGSFAELNTTRYAKVFGSDFIFVAHTFDVRKFFSIGKDRVLALQSVFRLSSGDVPVRNLSLIGGSELLRGYWKGRFADRNMLAFQADVRQHLLWRIGLVLFGGAAQVNHNADEFELGRFHYAYGGGLRILVQEKEKLNLRIDYGVGEHSTGLYVILKEAF